MMTFSQQLHCGLLVVADGSVVTGNGPGHYTRVNLNRPAVIYLGGVPNSVPELDASIAANSLVGTILKVALEGRIVAFDTDITSGFHVQNGTTCNAVGPLVTDFVCTFLSLAPFPPALTGQVCDTLFDHCTELQPCLHGGTCKNINTLPCFKCSCSYGLSGMSCREGKQRLWK